MILVVKNLLIIMACLLASFLNYCLFQVGIKFFAPITILPIFCSFVFGYRPPALAILAIGVIDDAMLNLPIGTLALVYSSIAYITSIFVKKSLNPLRPVYIFSALYIVVNFLALCCFDV